MSPPIGIYLILGSDHCSFKFNTVYAWATAALESLHWNHAHVYPQDVGIQITPFCLSPIVLHRKQATLCDLMPHDVYPVHEGHSFTQELYSSCTAWSSFWGKNDHKPSEEFWNFLRARNLTPRNLPARRWKGSPPISFWEPEERVSHP